MITKPGHDKNLYKQFLPNPQKLRNMRILPTHEFVDTYGVILNDETMDGDTLAHRERIPNKEEFKLKRERDKANEALGRETQ